MIYQEQKEQAEHEPDQFLVRGQSISLDNRRIWPD
jgi:hypothetical protein